VQEKKEVGNFPLHCDGEQPTSQVLQQKKQYESPIHFDREGTAPRCKKRKKCEFPLPVDSEQQHLRCSRKSGTRINLRSTSIDREQ
jgi:hypothetical protein